MYRQETQEEELHFQMSCYIIKQERKKGGGNASCLSGTNITVRSACQLIASDSHCMANKLQLSTQPLLGISCYLLGRR